MPWHTCKQAYVEVSVGQTGAVYRFCSVDVNKNPVVAFSDITVKLEVKGTMNYQTSFDLEYIIRSEACRHRNSFVCDDYLCIPEDKVCDGEVDCKNGEDEIKTKCGIKSSARKNINEALIGPVLKVITANKIPPEIGKIVAEERCQELGRKH
ncbi:uncharacterized protein CG3556 [Trichonephila clavipes]|nr:uncharacterized protein CG3556 [Trichonephila clavipes]